MILPINNASNNKCTHKKNQKKNLSPNFKAIRIINIENKYKNIEPFLNIEISKFHDKKSNAKFLGQGLFSKAYELLSFPKFVIKESLGIDKFELEDKGLNNAPKSLSGSQQFIARAYDDVDSTYYILSTKVEGEAAHPITRPWDKATLKKLFDGMFEMDKTGFYHGDLNNGNIKIDKNCDVNFIDYQWANKLGSYTEQFETKKEQCLPDFIPTLNSQMFEMAEIPHYLKQLKDLNIDRIPFINLYLSQKAQYHLDRAKFFCNNIELSTYQAKKELNEKRAIEFDIAQAKVLNNPTPEIIKLEAKKIQFLASFREAYRHVDPHTPIKNPLNAASAYLVTLNDVQWFRKEVEEQLKNATPDTYEYDYLKGMKDYGDYWFENISKWSFDALSCGINLAKRTTTFDGIQEGVNIEEFRSITHFLEDVNQDFSQKYTNNIEILAPLINETLESLQALIKKNDFVKSNTHKALENLLESIKKEKAFIVLNNALILHRRIIEDTQPKSRLEEKFMYSTRTLSEQEIIRKTEHLAGNLAIALFFKIHGQLVSNNIYSEKFCGYKNMNKF